MLKNVGNPREFPLRELEDACVQGDALYSMELALSLEKLNFIKLRELHRVASNAEDAQLADFIGALLLIWLPG